MRSTHLVLTTTCSLAAAGPAFAVDRWEVGGLDNGSSTTNELRHGTLQTAHAGSRTRTRRSTCGRARSCGEPRAFVVDAQAHFYDGAGALVHAQPLTLPLRAAWC